MSESQLRRNVIKILKGRHAKPIENALAAGTPDVNYAEGWIELKKLAKWPKNANTPVRIRHFTENQRLWLTDRWEVGGASWLLIQIDKTFLLYNGSDVNQIGSLTRAEMLELAAQRWEGLRELKEGLSQCLER